MDKIVDDKPESMGELDMTKDGSRLSCQVVDRAGRALWDFTVASDHITGTMKLLPGGNVVQEIDVYKNVSLPWTIASGRVDVDGDRVPDGIRVETPDGMRHVPLLPCAGCDDAVGGHFVAVVRLSKSGRTVRTPVIDHFPNQPIWWFPTNTGHSRLAIADYNGDGRPDFNLGQFTNSNKWEYVLFTIHVDGRVEKYALDKPEIYVSPGGEPSTAKIEAIPGGIRFRDFGNAGEHPGWATMTCLWHADRGEFRCSMR